jgi:L-rhamnose isomerase
MIQALLIALLELPALKVAEHEGDFTARLALMEQTKAMPWAVVWDEYCTRQNVPVGLKWLGEVKQYETSVLSQR